jgi:ABC-type sugar transport system permease subunit
MALILNENLGVGSFSAPFTFSAGHLRLARRCLVRDVTTAKRPDQRHPARNRSGRSAINWLGTLNTALPALLIYWVFYIGYYMASSCRSLRVDKDFYVAAEIDGASKIQQALVNLSAHD